LALLLRKLTALLPPPSLEENSIVENTFALGKMAFRFPSSMNTAVRNTATPCQKVCDVFLNMSVTFLPAYMGL
jgi:hypothetical protein